MKGFWAKVGTSLDENQHVFIALVAEHSAHSPGTAGAKLAVTESGDVFGTIGGGVMEYTLIARAREAIVNRSFTPELQVLYHRKDGPGEKSGMMCAGHQVNVYYLCTPSSDASIVSEIVAAAKHEDPGLLSISPLGMAFQRKNPDDAPQITLQHSGASVNDESESANDERATAERTNTDWRYIEQVLNLKRIAILGGGHCGLALSRVMHHLGYHVSVYDTRANLAILEENTYADRKEIVSDFANVGTLIPFPKLTHVVVMTTDITSDIRALLGTIDLPVPFLGAMGSSAKIGTIRKALRAHGVDEANIAGLCAPIGLPMQSDTPDEIAVSVAAQLLQRRKTVPTG